MSKTRGAEPARQDDAKITESGPGRRSLRRAVAAWANPDFSDSQSRVSLSSTALIWDRLFPFLLRGIFERTTSYYTILRTTLSKDLHIIGFLIMRRERKSEFEIYEQTYLVELWMRLGFFSLIQREQTPQCCSVRGPAVFPIWTKNIIANIDQKSQF